MNAHVDVMDLANRLKSAEEAFVLATVVRTVSVTAAKAGAKAVIRPDGTIVAGWIGGGCARGAVLRAARQALMDGKARLISVQPKELLAEHGVAAGELREGIQFSANMCPSKGTMDIFIEPVLPRPALVVFGASPVAMAVVEQAALLGFHVTLAAPAADRAAPPTADVVVDGFAIAEPPAGKIFALVATQGSGDLAALQAALALEADYYGFVGSGRKMASLKADLSRAGIPAERLDRIKGPAGLDLGAITPEEIALSILAEILIIRRRDQRGDTTTP
ncbi:MULTISPECIES: XdhC/CoxI family protein [unclassified Shinella]|uniref:XdhC family protein n=1 Tax=unclassified Shinella TaxID=2643062 RepID=UPI00225D7392|nr:MULTISPECIES: XdhC/CoxI family protein [unclassified Shinella]MCO5136389.1 XdhC/CoxI family protein [Shinella sp.]MDC7253936.1 XdhC/CoxI family protein [Shinella sp. YE25]CAI0336591.1 Carbon monoxide dehydrogenase F protein [Rhizobiaceae bacterium]CAK7255123.1 xanthine dehydrogenase accessory factor [Shinella sp. WSC3-e]